jgi:hypothetical protein
MFSKGVWKRKGPFCIVTHDDETSSYPSIPPFNEIWSGMSLCGLSGFQTLKKVSILYVLAWDSHIVQGDLFESNAEARLHRYIDGNSPVNWDKVKPLIDAYADQRIEKSSIDKLTKKFIDDVANLAKNLWMGARSKTDMIEADARMREESADIITEYAEVLKNDPIDYAAAALRVLVDRGFVVDSDQAELFRNDMKRAIDDMMKERHHA